MKVSGIFLRFFLGSEYETRRADVEREIVEQKAVMRQNTQAIQSGARIIGTMSGALKLMAAEANNEKRLP